MQCVTCGKELAEGAMFCSGCGTRLAAPVQQQMEVQPTLCQQCGKVLPPEEVFCGYCGAKVAAGQPPSGSLPGGQPSSGWDNRQMPHPFHSLGGWLLFIVIMNGLVGAGSTIAGIFYCYLANTVWSFSQSAGGLLLFLAAILLLLGILEFVFVSKIVKKDAGFFSFFEGLFTLNMVVIIIMLIINKGVNLYNFITIVASVLGFLLWSTYFRSSVRVRTYMGSDEYLKRSMFFSHTVPPVPADAYPPPDAQQYSQEAMQNSPQPEPELSEYTACLEQLGVGEGTLIPLTGGRFSLGRLAGEVDFAVASDLVSKFHAEFFGEGERHYVRDLGSKNGTFVNGTQIQVDLPCELRDGDRVRLADCEFTFHVNVA